LPSRNAAVIPAAKAVAVNGVLFAVYHLHVPWVIPAGLLDAFILAYPSKRYRSALVGIAVHSAQSVFFLALVLSLVLAG
jgi:membrane protease YdiL (CAAX protease family)